MFADTRASYMVFDLLAVDGQDLRGRPADPSRRPGRTPAPLRRAAAAGTRRYPRPIIPPDADPCTGEKPQGQRPPDHPNSSWSVLGPRRSWRSGHGRVDGSVLDHPAKRSAGGVEVVLQTPDLIAEVLVDLPGPGEFMAQGGDPLDQWGGGEVGELPPEGALQVAAEFVPFTS